MRSLTDRIVFMDDMQYKSETNTKRAHKIYFEYRPKAWGFLTIPRLNF